MKRLLPRARAFRFACGLLVAGGIYAILPAAQALNGHSASSVAAAPQPAPQVLGVAKSLMDVAPEPSAWIATLCGVGLLLGLRRVRRAA